MILGFQIKVQTLKLDIFTRIGNEYGSHISCPSNLNFGLA